MKSLFVIAFILAFSLELPAQCDENSLRNFFVRKLNETSFTPEAEQYARSVAGKFLSLATLENFEEVFIINPINSTFSINISALPSNMQNLEWEGSRDGISTNALGQYTAKPDKSNKGETNAIEKKFNTLVVNWLIEYMNSYEYQREKRYQNVTHTRIEAKMNNVENNIFDKIFHSNDQVCKQYFNTIPNEFDRKVQIMEWSAECFDSYRKTMITDSDKYIFEPVPANEMKIKEAVRNKDWTTFIRECALNGWTPGLFFQEKGILSGR